MSKSKSNPWKTLVQARNNLSTAENYLGDAVGELHETEFPPTPEHADDRANAVERHIRNAEREIERARERLGIEREKNREGAGHGGNDE